MRTHTNDRPFICVFCEKSFKLASNLNKHMKLHTEEKVYACSECQQKFPTAGKLKKHRLEGGCSTNNSAANQCQYCDKTFPDVEQLNGHMLTHFVTDGSSYSTTAS
ncbi:hypothetical protein LAZ67_6003489 [Cordylochernes scorpioides]|nr:hypothetical protein LAZ67_6003489 [Cordylochernes scorpioides]